MLSSSTTPPPPTTPRFATFNASPISKVRVVPGGSGGRLPFVTGDSSGKVTLFSASTTANVAKPGALYTAQRHADTVLKADAVTDIAAVDPHTVVAADAAGVVHIVGIAADLATLTLKSSFNPHAWGAVTAIHVQSSQVVSVGVDASVTFTDLSTLKKTTSIADADSSALTGVKWRSAHEVVVSTDSGRLALFDDRGKRVASAFQDLQHPDIGLNCVAVHPSLQYSIATGCQDGSVKVWDLRNLTYPEIQTFHPHSSEIWDIVFPSHDPTSLLTASQDGSITQFKYNHNNMADAFTKHRTSDKSANVKKVEGLGASVNSVDCFHEVEGLIVAGGDAGQVLLTNI
ncbi:Nucleoporin Nup43 [Rhizoclosmatium hyalinum]|nr:Nucleoporin Nup43 [Rhizoclosmatium hyalinum]